MTVSPGQTPASSAWSPFRHGRLTGFVVNDGPLRLGSPERQFPAQPADEVRRAVRRAGGQEDSFEIDQNVLILEIAGKLVMFDVGVGPAAAWGVRRFGPETGKLVERLQELGLQPEQIDVIALTHAHPDHSWGLVGEDGERLFPRAQLAVAAADVAHFLARAEEGGFANEAEADRYLGAARALRPYLDGARLLSDGDEVAPGVTAVATPGHTPGHLAFVIADPAGDLVFWGDLCHHAVLLHRPQWSTGFDHDGAEASAQRVRFFERVSTPTTRVLSYHFPFPGYGSVVPHLDGAGDRTTEYRWVPQE